MTSRTKNLEGKFDCLHDFAEPETPSDPDYQEKKLKKEVEENLEKFHKNRGDHFSGLLSSVDSSNVEIIKEEIYFKPFWLAEGEYECKWLNEQELSTIVDGDVKAVKIGDEYYTARRESLKISDALSSLNISAGMIGTSLGKFKGAISNALGDKDKKISGRRQVVLSNSVEYRLREREKTICIDAISGKRNEEMKEELKKARLTGGKPSSSKNVKTHEVSKDYVLEGLEEEVVKSPKDDAEGIIKQEMKINELLLVFVPFAEVEYDYEGERKELTINLLTEEKLS